MLVHYKAAPVLPAILLNKWSTCYSLLDSIHLLLVLVVHISIRLPCDIWYKEKLWDGGPCLPLQKKEVLFAYLLISSKAYQLSLLKSVLINTSLCTIYDSWIAKRVVVQNFICLKSPACCQDDNTDP